MARRNRAAAAIIGGAAWRQQRRRRRRRSRRRKRGIGSGGNGESGNGGNHQAIAACSEISSVKNGGENGIGENGGEKAQWRRQRIGGMAYQRTGSWRASSGGGVGVPKTAAAGRRLRPSAYGGAAIAPLAKRRATAKAKSAKSVAAAQRISGGGVWQSKLAAKLAAAWRIAAHQAASTKNRSVCCGRGAGGQHQPISGAFALAKMKRRKRQWRRQCLA